MPRIVNDTDRAIIRLLQGNARMSYAELSRATGTPESTVRRRMDRLQQRGVIEFAMVAEPGKLGYDLRAMIGLKIDLLRLNEVAERLRALNEVTFAAFLTGNFDIMIHVVVESQEDLVGLLSEKLSQIEGVRSTETFVMPWIIKPTTSWVLPEHESDRPTLGVADALADDGLDADLADLDGGDDEPDESLGDDSAAGPADRGRR